MTSCLSRLRKSDHGTASVEFALVGLIAITMFLGLIEFGRGLYMRTEMSFAMDMAERKILINPATADADVEAVIRQAISYDIPASLQITFGTRTVNGQPFRTILIRYPVTLLIPGLANASVMLNLDRLVPLT